MSERRTALITGILGQDGRLLARRLRDDGYRVIGITRPGRESPGDGPGPGVEVLGVDLADSSAVEAVLGDRRPDEIYHLAAVHHSSQEDPLASGLDVREAMFVHNFLSTRAIISAMARRRSRAHLVFAASSQMYTAASPQHEITEDSRRDPPTFYGLTKSWCMEMLAFFRAHEGLRASGAILFNHESTLRDPRFVSRKITQAAARARAGLETRLELLNVGARVDWCDARDVAQALTLMARAEAGGDYVVASGRLHTVRDLLRVAFGHVGLDWRDFVSFRRDAEEPARVGQPRQIRETLGWSPAVPFEDMIVEMVEHDRRRLDGTAGAD